MSFALTNLSGFMAGETPNEGGGVTLVHSVQTDGVNNNTWTVSSASFGAEPGGSSTRTMVLGVTGTVFGGATDGTFTIGATIAGNAMDQRVSAIRQEGEPSDTNTGGWDSVAFCWMGTVALPTGTSGDVVVTLTGFDQTMANYGMALFRVINITSAVPTTTPTGEPITLVVPSNGFGLILSLNTESAYETNGNYSGTNITTIYTGSTAMGAAWRTVAGSQSHGSTNNDDGRGATWTYTP